MSSLKALLGMLAAGLMLSGCMQATTYQPAPEASLKPADKAQLAKARYEKVAVHLDLAGRERFVLATRRSNQ